MTTRYRIVEQAAGEGGFGRIDKAQDTELERFVAIKVLDPLFKDTPSEEDKERFKREAKTLASLSHPNIPAIYDVKFSEEEGEFNIIFEWIDGSTVKNILANQGFLSLEEVRKWFSNICSALEHAHGKGIIHRDLKPSNMIVTRNMESCYIVDFGISLRPTDLERLTDGTGIGTPGYMSPEQERGEELNPSSDIYSLGVVLYECLAGMRPSVGEYKPLSISNEAIPPAIDELVKNCLAQREIRLNSASEFIERLSQALRPHSSLSTILSQGALHEIQTALTQMNAPEYGILPASQRRLIMSRLRDLIRVDAFNMRNAVASLLSELIRVGFQASQEDYAFIVEKGLEYGYEMHYSEAWQGNRQIREKLNEVAILFPRNAHNVLSDKLLTFLETITELNDRDGWYHHDLRILLQNLLANGNCADEQAGNLGDKLDQINEISHSPFVEKSRDTLG